MKKKVVEKPDYNASLEDWLAYQKAHKGKYKKLMRATRKALVKQAKNWYPWEETFLYDMMGLIFKGWEEYYKLGINVSGMEKKDEAKSIIDDVDESDCFFGWSSKEKALEEAERLSKIPTREEIAHTLLELLEKEEKAFWDWSIDGNELREKAMKDFTDFFAEYIHYMWD